VAVIADFLDLEILGLLSIAVLFAAIFIGFPIAFTLIAVALFFGFAGLGEVVMHLMVLQVFAVMRDPTLASVPFFLFMGYLLEQSGLMERLFRGIQLLLAGVRGSLYLAVLVTATIFAAATGIVGSSVTLLGVMAAPSMKRSGYDVRMSAGAITAGGTLGILIPPSVMLIVMGPVVGVPATHLFAAAVFPGLLLAGLYITYALVRSYINPELGPALPPEERPASIFAVLRELAVGVLPVVIVILATLGTILAGIATPTDAGAVGAFAVLVLTILYRRLSWSGLYKSAIQTLETSSMILILVAASNFFGAVFSRLGSATYIAEALLGLPLPPMLMLMVILALIFVLGWPLEWVPIVLIVVPIFLPLVQQLNVDLVLFCTLVAVCLQTAWLSPPVALSAYFLKGVVPEWDLGDIYAGMAQFMVLQVAGLLLIVLFPQIALWLPAALF
jgi:tripartite ATP-independent transporter DctM subunit